MTEHHHDHGHAPHPNQPDLEDQPLEHYQIMQIAVRDLLIEKGIIGAEEMRAQVERTDALSPARGAELVARAWLDDDFRSRLVADSKAAAAELDIDAGPVPILVMENTPSVHNVIVCTLCSCYPRYLLGLPPDWYKSREYRARTVREPRTVLAEFGTEIGPEVDVRVHDSTADMRYMVLPMRPPGTESLDEAGLRACVTRDCLIGVTLPRPPAS